jgi:hypothetical protein
MIKREGKEWVEDVLEAWRPRGYADRQFVHYAFDSVGDCLRFSRGEERQRPSGIPWHIYQVEMDQPSRHPLEVIHRIYTLRVTVADPPAESLAREYWQPTSPGWRRFEYIGSERFVVGAHGPLSQMAAVMAVGEAGGRAQDDMKLAARLWP